MAEEIEAGASAQRHAPLGGVMLGASISFGSAMRLYSLPVMKPRSSAAWGAGLFLHLFLASKGVIFMRSTTIKVPDKNPGIISAEGTQYSFELAGAWQGDALQQK